MEIFEAPANGRACLAGVYPFTEMDLVQKRTDLPEIYVVAAEAFLLGFGYQTARAYAGDLTAWSDWCLAQQPIVDPLNGGTKDVESYLREMLESGYSPNTIARRLTALRGFFDTLTTATRNPARAVPAVRRRRKPPGPGRRLVRRNPLRPFKFKNQPALETVKAMGILYDRKHDGGKGQVKKTNIPLDGSKVHVTQYNKKNNTRVSWNADGKSKDSARNQHPTNQGVKRGRSGRH